MDDKVYRFFLNIEYKKFFIRYVILKCMFFFKRLFHCYKFFPTTPSLIAKVGGVINFKFEQSFSVSRHPFLNLVFKYESFSGSWKDFWYFFTFLQMFKTINSRNLNWSMERNPSIAKKSCLKISAEISPINLSDS